MHVTAYELMIRHDGCSRHNLKFKQWQSLQAGVTTVFMRSRRDVYERNTLTRVAMITETRDALR
jgi:hypothetical protein